MTLIMHSQTLMDLSVQVREAEEARARDKARREAEAKKQAKTRVLMSSLFDKVSDRSLRVMAQCFLGLLWDVYSLVLQCEMPFELHT